VDAAEVGVGGDGLAKEANIEAEGDGQVADGLVAFPAFGKSVVGGATTTVPLMVDKGEGR
jgi:hypothetical protein